MGITKINILRCIVGAVISLSSALAVVPAATIVSVETPVGTFEIDLFDDVAPITVENFLKYIADGDFEDSFIHRSVPGFVIQGGGFTVEDGIVTPVPTDPPIQNEAGISNTRGTIAMAQAGTNPNSATSQWFINLVDNDGSGLNNLDTLNGGFAVFGRVRGDGMTVVDTLAAIPRYNASRQLGSAFTTLPLLQPTLELSSIVWTTLTVAVEETVTEDVPLPPPAVALLAGALALMARRWSPRLKR